MIQVLRPYQIWATTSLPTKGWAKGLMFGGSFCLKLSILIQSPLIVKRYLRFCFSSVSFQSKFESYYVNKALLFNFFFCTLIT